MENKIVSSAVIELKTLFANKFDVDFYQREYVWQKKQIEDLINDLSTEFLRNWKAEDTTDKVKNYDPYYMGEIVLSDKIGRKAIIDGQQRITTFTLLLIYLNQQYKDISKFPTADINQLIYSDYFGSKQFNLMIDDRKECMLDLYENGNYNVKSSDSISVRNLVDRYDDISECWNESINEKNVAHFAYWLKEKIVFSKVWTNSDEFAYIIFETMNDRGLSLTQVEMIRSYLLSCIEADRDGAMKEFDNIIQRLINIKLTSKSKAEIDFFKIFLRGHYAEDLSQSKNSSSDFTRIGNEFHRWVRDNSERLGLTHSKSYFKFIQRIGYYAEKYEEINNLIHSRNAKEYLYLIVNHDYGFTLQPALILASIAYMDDEHTVEQKIKIISKYLTKVLSWRVWNHWLISQSSLEAPIYELCKSIRGKSVVDIELILSQNPICLLELANAPTVNQQNRKKLRVLLSLITEIVASNAGAPDYMLNKKDIEIEHIWANHFSRYENEVSGESEFVNIRNNIGDLLVLPKSFNASYGDDPYQSKIECYYEQNILAQSLNEKKYTKNPGFAQFRHATGLAFKSYNDFKHDSIIERSELYKKILEWNWK